MKAFKKVLLIPVLAFVLTACTDDFLAIPPQDRASVEAFYKSESDFESAVVGLYSNWRINAVRVPAFLEFRSDNLYGLRADALELSTNDFGPNTGATWWDMYEDLIAPANTILERIDKIEFSENSKNRIKGEALFFRGYAYYWMNLVFGGVPLVNESISIEGALALGRSSEEDTWVQVESDLSTAFDLLPEVASEKGRVDKYAAGGFLARTFLQQQKWDEAVPVLAQVYQESGHILEDSWADMWSLETEGSAEYMLVSIGSVLLNHNDYAQFFLSFDSNLGGTLGPATFNYKPGLLEAFVEGDLRKDFSIGRTQLSNFPENRKYDFGFVDNNWTFDIVALRFSDIVLMYAEAISMAAGSPQQLSIDLINETRKRAGLADLVLSDVPSLDAFIEVVLNERRVELLWEGVRFADLKRHNLLVEKINALSPEFNFDETYNYLPIPQREIDKYPEDVLLQNEGY